MNDSSVTSLGLQLATLDYWVLAVYGFVLLAIIITVSVKQRSGDAYFLAGRSLTWGVIGFSLFASNISSTTLLGLTGSAYEWGIAVGNYEWLAGVPLLFAVFFVVPIYLKSRIRTVPEYLELRFDERSRKLFSGLTIALTVFVDTAGGLYAGSVVLQLFFPQYDLWVIVPGLAIFAGCYASLGGLRVVAYTDVLQAVALLAGCAFLAYFVLEGVDLMNPAQDATLPASHAALLLPLDDPHLPWFGTLFALPLMGFWYWTTNQYVVQRVLAARNLDQARKGMIFAGFLKLLPLFLIVIPAAYASLLLPPNLPVDKVFPTMVATLLPAGLVGLVIAAMFSAILSSVDSTLNSAASLIVLDFIEAKQDFRIMPAEEARLGQICTIVLMIIAAIWAPLIQYFGGLWDYLQLIFAAVVPPVVVVFLGGLFWSRGTADAAFITILAGLAMGVLEIFLQASEIVNWHFTISVPFITLLCAIVFYVVSINTEPRSEEDLADVIFRRNRKRNLDIPPILVSRFQFWAAALAALLVVVLLGFLVVFLF